MWADVLWIRQLQSELISNRRGPSPSSSSSSFVVLMRHPLAFVQYTKGSGDHDHDHDGRDLEDLRRRRYFVAALHAVVELKKSAVGLNRKTKSCVERASVDHCLR